jgi:hypothetical protein
MRRSLALLLAIAGALLVGGPASSAFAYGGGATHDTWQVGLSFNCDNPTSAFCLNPETGAPELGGFWGWYEFDRSGDATWGDAELTGCGHTTGGGGPGSAGAGHFHLDISAWHLGAPGPDDPPLPPGAQVFYVDDGTVTFTGAGGPVTIPLPDDFKGDTGIPSTPGHYAFHPDPGVAGSLTVAYRPAR